MIECGTLRSEGREGARDMDPKAKHKIVVKEFVADMRSGMTDGLLMEKYRLSARGLNRAFEKLKSGGFIGNEDILRRVPSYEDTVDIDPFHVGLFPAEELVCLVPVYEAGHPERQGLICNITHSTLEISGLAAEVGETREFIVAADLFFDLDPFPVEAACLWVKPKAFEGDDVCGFQITNVPDDHRDKLTNLTRLVTGAQ
jgi:hypothetical protein